MTATSEPNDSHDVTDNALDDAWLASQHRDLGSDLAGALDLGTGLREILLAGQHRDMGTDLSSALNLAAGLAAILPPHNLHLALPTQFNDFADLLDWLSAAPMVRLTHRNHLSLLAVDTEILHLTATRAIGPAVDRASDRSLLRDLVRGRSGDHERAADHVLKLVHALEHAVADFVELDRALDQVLDHALDSDYYRVLKLERKLGRALDRVREHNLDHYRNCSRNLELAGNIGNDLLCFDSALDRALDGLHAVTLDSVRELVQAPDIVKTVAQDLARVHDQAYDLAQLACGASVHFEVQNLLRGINDRTPEETHWLDPMAIGPRDTDRLNELAADFIGVDLREASLSGLDLIGVRWSRTTQWPRGDVDWIVAASEPVGNGIYVIQGSSTAGGAIVVPDPVPV